jgi:hypothetical protein
LEHFGHCSQTAPGAYPTKNPNIGLQTVVFTNTNNIFVAFNQYSLVGPVFCDHFEPIV